MATKDGKKTGGRKKGTPNKRTLDLAEKFEQSNFCPVASIMALIEEQYRFRDEYLNESTSTNRIKKISRLMMTSDELVKALSDTLPYLYPKRKAVELKNEKQEVVPVFNIQLRDRGEN